MGGSGLRYGLALVAWGLLGGCDAAPFATTSEVRFHRLGQTDVAFVLHASAPPQPDRPAFLVLHDDEDTAVAAGLAVLRAQGGRLVELRAEGVRLVSFEKGGVLWRFDPNRIFTEAGVQGTLLQNNGSAPAEVWAEVRRFGEAILAVHGRAPLLVTLHNNSDGGYSAAGYLPETALASDAAAVYLPPQSDPDDFFFVTERWLFDRLVEEGFPVVLQDSTRAADDGSLSVWAGRERVPYVNVETEHGHGDQQERMLTALSRVLASDPRAAC